MSMLPLNARIDGKEIVGSGFALVEPNNVLTVDIADLSFDFVFVNDGNELHYEIEQPGPKSLRIRLKNFNNSLGSAFGPAGVGTFQGRNLTVSLYVSGIGDSKLAVSYCFVLGFGP